MITRKTSTFLTVIKNFIFLMLIINLSLVTVCFAQEVRTVTIRNENFEIVKKLESSPDIINFSKQWHEKTKQTSAKRNWKFKIDIEPGDRWLYDPEGYVRVLTVKSSASDYKIKSAETFNKLLGINNN